jgi:hypothetical protein
VVGIYYVAQQVASLPQKLKTSFDPILGPVITQKLAENDRPAVAKQVRQVGFWIIAAQVGVALALAIPGEAVMGLVGPNFVGGTGALAFCLPPKPWRRRRRCRKRLWSTSPASQPDDLAVGLSRCRRYCPWRLILAIRPSRTRPG